MISAASADDAAVRELAREILSRREYGAVEPSSWLVDVLAWLGNLGIRIAELRISSPALYWTLFGGMVVASVLLIAHVIWTLVAALRMPEAPSPARPARTGPDLAREAEELAAAGRHLEAAHRLMIASLATAARAAVIDIRPEHTNRVIRERLSGSPLPSDLRSELTELIAATERRWFRDRENDPEIYVRWRAAFGRLAGGG